MSLLVCEGLVKDYPGKRAVDGVDFDVNEGEIVGLLGPNGAGKSTTFRMACGLAAPTKGRVLLRGKDVTNWAMYQRAQAGLGICLRIPAFLQSYPSKRTFWPFLSFAESAGSLRRPKLTSCWVNSDCWTSELNDQDHFPEENAAAWKLLEHSPAILRSCCWTNRLRELTR